MIVSAPSPPAHVIRFAAGQHSAFVVVRQPTPRADTKRVEVMIKSPRDLPRGPIRYEGGYKQQKLAATVFLYNTKRDFFAAGLALHAGGGRSCVRQGGEDVCHTFLPVGFLRSRKHHWKKLKITLFKPARRAATVRVLLRRA